MPYEIGTADGYVDLLERLKDFLSDPARTTGDAPNISELVAIDDDTATGAASQAWTVENWDDQRDTAGDGEAELVLNGPGASGVDEIFVAIDTYSSAGDDYYNWRIMGMTGYATGTDLSLQPGVTQGRLPRMLLYKRGTPLAYWFFGNGRRFIVVAKVSSVYESCYGGFILPYGLPTQFPYPLVIGGAACPSTTASYQRYSSTEASHRAFANPYSNVTTPGQIPVGVFDTVAYYSTLKCLIGASWVAMKNRDGATYYHTNIVWPYINSAYGGSYDPDIFSKKLRENIDGTYPVFPTIVIINNPAKHIAGELQGVFAVPGFGGIAAEDTFTIGSDTYITFPVVPNAERCDFMAIKKE